MDALDLSQIAANWSTAHSPLLGAAAVLLFDYIKKLKFRFVIPVSAICEVG
jgi:hypothetical protein